MSIDVYTESHRCMWYKCCQTWETRSSQPQSQVRSSERTGSVSWQILKANPQCHIPCSKAPLPTCTTYNATRSLTESQVLKYGHMEAYGTQFSFRSSHSCWYHLNFYEYLLNNYQAISNASNTNFLRKNEYAS